MFDEKVIPGTLCADLSDGQIGAVKYSLKLAIEIQKTFPQMADEYRKGASLSTLNKRYYIDTLFDVSAKTAQEAIRYALGGYYGNFNIVQTGHFIGLIPKDEYQTIAKNHNTENSRKIGLEYRDRGLGLFKITKEERREIGKKSAKKQMEQKIGIHAQTPAQRRILGQKAILSQGGTPYSDEELEFIKELANDLAYRNHRNEVKASLIAEKVNTKFHQGKMIRNGSKITRVIMRYKFIKTNLE